MGAKRDLKHKGHWLTPASVLHCADLASGWLRRQAERFWPRYGQGLYMTLLVTLWGCIRSQEFWLKPVVKWRFTVFLIPMLTYKQWYAGAVFRASRLMKIVGSVLWPLLFTVFDVDNCLDGYALGFSSRIQEGKVFGKLVDLNRAKLCFTT